MSGERLPIQDLPLPFMFRRRSRHCQRSHCFQHLRPAEVFFFPAPDIHHRDVPVCPFYDQHHAPGPFQPYAVYRLPGRGKDLRHGPCCLFYISLRLHRGPVQVRVVLAACFLHPHVQVRPVMAHLVHHLFQHGTHFRLLPVLSFQQDFYVCYFLFLIYLFLDGLYLAFGVVCRDLFRDGSREKQHEGQLCIPVSPVFLHEMVRISSLRIFIIDTDES